MKPLTPDDKRKFLLLAVITVVVLVVDQYTKHLVHTGFSFGESRKIIPNFFALTYVRNTGAAFGLLHRAPAYFREPFFIIVPVVALFAIGFYFYLLKPHQKLGAWGLSLIFSGAIGNLIDRIRFGFVVDFLDFHWKEVYHWPAFNVADSAIVVGVGMVLLDSFRTERVTA